mmetsp:Transcript_4044/g.5951  ORF Transcript_4044/g.5951 Transcript_4044/m.5951 type:complete len:320 (-) Transcript_4044:1049-2008(-)
MPILDIDVAGRAPIRPPTLRRPTKRYGDGHICQFDRAAIDGKCRLCHYEHDECVMIGSNSMCQVCYRQPETCPREESKCHYIVDKLEHLHKKFETQSSARVFSLTASRAIGELVQATTQRELKVIVFSQFRKALNMVGHRLLQRFGAGAVAEYWGKYRDQELTKFVHKTDCFCMLLGKDGSEGLDLSFVTHIIFIEEVWDKALENQCIARAWRMGAKGRVEVETLVAKDSIEEMMARLEAGQSIVNDGSSKNDIYGEVNRDHQGTKLIYLLKNLRLMRDKPLENKIQGEKIALLQRATGEKAQRKDEAPPRKKARVRFE